MKVMIVLPLNINNRFEKDLRKVFEIGMMDYGMEPVFVDSGYESVAMGNDFTDIYMHLHHDAEVVKHVAKRIREWQDDVVPIFWYDLFFTGILGGLVAVLNMVAKRMGKKVINIGYIHGGVWCSKDIYHESRYPVFTGMRDISYMLGAERIYTGSKHHKQQIIDFAKKVIKGYYAQLLNNIIDVNPIPHIVRVKRREKDIDVFIPHSRYEYGRNKLLMMANELRSKGYKVYVADQYLGDKYVDMLSRSKVVLICKEHETYGVAETEAIHNYALPFCPFECESKEVMEEVHAELYVGVYESVGDDIYSLVRNYDIIAEEIRKYLSRIRDNYRWLDIGTLIHNMLFFKQLAKYLKDMSRW